jgi:hypothetical protein
VIRTAGITAAIHGAFVDNGQRAVGERIDVAKSTLGDWGTDIRSWPGDKLLELSAAFPEVGRAVIDALAGEAQQGRASDATRAGFGAIVSGNTAMAGIATDLADGTLSPREARGRLPALREARRDLDRLILDAEAVAAAGGQIGGRHGL